MTQSAGKKIKIILTGGGTGGSVTPLLAIADELACGEGRYSFTWIGTNDGVERYLTAHYPFTYKPIASGKLRRYFDIRNLTDIALIIIGFFQAFFILLSERPRLIVTAGSFVSVPVVWAGWLLGIPSLVHQQDIVPGLANKLMAPFARVITVAFEKSLSDYGKKAAWVGNPVRKEFITAQQNPPKPARKNIVVLGGGTGSEAINSLIADSLPGLTPVADVVHITGQRPVAVEEAVPHYYSYEMLDPEHIAQALAGADLVVCRAGLGTLSELAFLGKPAVVIPIPDSHQEINAKYFQDRDAAIVLAQRTLDPDSFTATVKDMLDHEERREKMSQNMQEAMKTGANQAMHQMIDKSLG